MSIVATKDIVAGEEVLVSYNHDIPHAQRTGSSGSNICGRPRPSAGARSASKNGASDWKNVSGEGKARN